MSDITHLITIQCLRFCDRGLRAAAGGGAILGSPPPRRKLPGTIASSRAQPPGKTASAGTKTPRAIIARLNQETVRLLQSPEMKQRFFNSGIEGVASSPEQFAAAIKPGSARLDQVIKSAGIRTR